MNGHKNWNHWNVSLWLFNEEPMYRMMCNEVQRARTLDDAARNILHNLSGGIYIHTPDGAPYTFTSIRAALRRWDS